MPVPVRDIAGRQILACVNRHPGDEAATTMTRAPALVLLIEAPKAGQEILFPHGPVVMHFECSVCGYVELYRKKQGDQG